MTKPDFRLDHTMIRVFDQEKTMDFYTRILGMKILRQTEYPEGRFTNTFVGYQGEDEGTTIEMTYNWDQQEPYDFGSAWGIWRSRFQTSMRPLNTSSRKASNSCVSPAR